MSRVIVAAVETIRTLIKLVLVVLRYFKDISMTAGSVDRISCLKRVPHMIWVDDFKNCTGTAQCQCAAAFHLSEALLERNLSRQN